MKKFSFLLTIAALGVALVSTWSCEPKIDSGPSATVTKLAGGDPAFPSTSASFDLATTAMESYVYKVVAGENKPSPDPVILYAEAEEVYKLTDGTTKVNVYGLEGSRKYTIHFAFKLAGANQYICKSVSTATPQYSQLINVISAERMKLTVQFNAPDTMYYKYMVVEAAQYPRAGADIDYIENGGTLAKGPLVVTVEDGKYHGMPIKPGSSYVVLFAECDPMGDIEIEIFPIPRNSSATSKASAIKPNSTGYTETCPDDWYKFVDKYAKLNVWTAPPKQGGGSFTITPKITEINAYFKVVPPMSVKKYGAVVVNNFAWTQELIPAVGEDGAIAYALNHWTKEISGEQVVRSTEVLLKDTVYRLLLIGICDDTGETQVQNIYEFKPIVSNEPFVDMIVTPIKDTENNPYTVHFNIKAPNKDCVNAKYLLGYTKDWARMLNSGNTYENMLNTSSNIFSVDQVKLINSDAGLTLDFPSLENIENRIVVGGYNIDDRLKIAIAETRSLPEPAKPRVESPLFNDLLGNWQATYKYRIEPDDKQTYEVSFPVQIADSPESVPSTFVPGNKQYDDLHKYFVKEGTNKKEPDPQSYATTKIAEQIVDYEKTVAQYKTKYREQNRIIMRGFAYSKFNGLEYKSPFDLFCDLNYSAYDNDELMYEYGPKMFLEIKKDNGKDVLTLQTNTQTTAPLSGHFFLWSMRVGGTLDGTVGFGEFPIEVASDSETMRIKRLTNIKGTNYTFSVLTQNANGGLSLKTVAIEDIVLQRTATRGPANFLSQKAEVKNQPPTYNPRYIGKIPGVSNIMPRTKLPTATGVPANLRQGTGSDVSFDASQAIDIPLIRSMK